MGLPGATPTQLVYRDCGLLPLSSYLKLSCAKYISRAQTVPNSTGTELTESTGCSIRSSTQKLAQAAGVDGVRAAPRPIPPRPPWLTVSPHVNTDMQNIRKSDNPLYSGVVAREFISNNLSNTLCIYTDGSLGKDGGGAAFYIPAMGKLARRYHLPYLNIFTIELYAIYMALNFIIDLKKYPLSITVLSDSMAALAAIASGTSSTREDIVLEIQAMSHHLIVQGCLVNFQWVPSHVGVTGNEVADAHAKDASAGRGARVNPLKLAYSDIRNKLTNTSWDEWARAFLAKKDAYGANDPSPPTRSGVFFPTIPTPLAHIIYRLRAGVWKTIHIPKTCECGGLVSPHHIIFNCPSFKNTFKHILEKLNLLKLPLSLGSLCVPQEEIGWGLAVEIATQIFNSKAGLWL